LNFDFRPPSVGFLYSPRVLINMPLSNGTMMLTRATARRCERALSSAVVSRKALPVSATSGAEPADPFGQPRCNHGAGATNGPWTSPMRRFTSLAPSLASALPPSSSFSTSFFSTQAPATTSASVGVFGVPGLHRPADWAALASHAIARCDAYRAELAAYNGKTSPEAAPRQLLLLDGVSNAVCSVIDAAELCRNVHASHEWRVAAEDAFEHLAG